MESIHKLKKGLSFKKNDNVKLNSLVVKDAWRRILFREVEPNLDIKGLISNFENLDDLENYLLKSE